MIVLSLLIAAQIAVAQPSAPALTNGETVENVEIVLETHGGFNQS